MFISIVENRSGEQLLLRRLAPNESIDPEIYCERWAEQMGVTIAKPNGYIPRGCADFYAETRHTKEPTGVCWQSFDFYLESDDE
jgi:hypothetical protein